MSKAVLKRLASEFGDEMISTHSKLGDDTAVVKKGRVRDIALWLRDAPENDFAMMRDVTAVDYLSMGRTPRFEVVYHLYSLSHRHALRIKIPLEEDDLAVDSLSDVWPAANWGEREVWDMFGVRFGGHPDLRRILLYEEFEGHPLRKDYNKRESQPRIDLVQAERDAIQEYHAWDEQQDDGAGTPPAAGAGSSTGTAAMPTSKTGLTVVQTPLGPILTDKKAEKKSTAP